MESCAGSPELMSADSRSHVVTTVGPDRLGEACTSPHSSPRLQLVTSWSRLSGRECPPAAPLGGQRAWGEVTADRIAGKDRGSRSPRSRTWRRGHMCHCGKLVNQLLTNIDHNSIGHGGLAEVIFSGPVPRGNSRRRVKPAQDVRCQRRRKRSRISALDA